MVKISRLSDAQLTHIATTSQVVVIPLNRLETLFEVYMTVHVEV